MYCSRCGNRVPPESLFCNRCGNKIDGGSHSQHSRSTTSPMVRPARRRIAVADEFANEPSFEDDYDEYEEVEEYADDEPEIDHSQEETAIFTISPAFYEVGTQYSVAIVLSIAAMALLGALSIPIWIGVAFTVICLIRPIYNHIQHNHTVYKLTTVKVEIRSGLFSKTSRNIPLRHIQDVMVSETFKERLIGIGDVMIDSASDEGKIPMRNIKNPRKYADLILNQLQYWN